MTDLLLDTSAYSHFRRGDPATRDRLVAAPSIYLPTVVLGELRAGFELGDRLRDNVATLQAFLDEPFVHTLGVEAGTAVRYGRLFAALRRAGTPIPINDVWIAACAQEVGAPILTFDRDFLHVPGVDVVLLPDDA